MVVLNVTEWTGPKTLDVKKKLQRYWMLQTISKLEGNEFTFQFYEHQMLMGSAYHPSTYFSPQFTVPGKNILENLMRRARNIIHCAEVLLFVSPGVLQWPDPISLLINKCDGRLQYELLSGFGSRSRMLFWYDQVWRRSLPRISLGKYQERYIVLLFFPKLDLWASYL